MLPFAAGFRLLREEQQYRGRFAVVLGASGFIGRWMARALGQAGARVQLWIRSREGAGQAFEWYGVRGEIVVVDVRNLDAVARGIRRNAPDIVFNLAGYGVDPAERDEAEARVLNSDLVGIAAEAVAGLPGSGWRGRRFVHVGTAAEYGAAGGDLEESTAPVPTTTYGRTKLAGTLALGHVCRESGLRGVTARLFTVYGPGEHAGRLLPSLRRAAVEAGPIALTQGLQRRDFTYVEEVVEGLLRLGATIGQPGEVLNLGTGRLSTVRDFVTEAARILRIDAARLRFGALPTRQDEMEHDPVNVERLRGLLGWVPRVTVGEGIRRTVAFESKE